MVLFYIFMPACCYRWQRNDANWLLVVISSFYFIIAWEQAAIQRTWPLRWPRMMQSFWALSQYRHCFNRYRDIWIPTILIRRLGVPLLESQHQYELMMTLGLDEFKFMSIGIFNNSISMMLVRYLLPSVCLRLRLFSQLSFIQYMGLCVFSLPNSPVMVVRMCTLSYYHHQIGSMNR